MLKYVNFDIVFREVPDEVTLAVNLSGCPCRCQGCHSPQLQTDCGEELTAGLLNAMLDHYGNSITCLCFMGGDAAPMEVAALAAAVKPRIRTAWYSGRPHLPEGFPLQYFNYVKTGPYMPQYGPLDHPATNQRMYRVTESLQLEDITPRMRYGTRFAV